MNFNFAWWIIQLIVNDLLFFVDQIINRLTTANEAKVKKLIAGDAKYQMVGA